MWEKGLWNPVFRFSAFFRNFLIAQGVPVHIVRPERQRKSICSHSEMASKGLQMPNAMELVGNRERKRNVRIREQRMGCSGNGGGSGAWYPFAPGRREKRRAAGQVRLSLARRYNTLDLAGKVSVPRGCGPFGNPREEERREAGATRRLLPVRDCDGGDSGRHCLPGDRVLWRVVSEIRLDTEQQGAALSAFLRNPAKCRGPERSAFGLRVGAMPSAHPVWLHALRG